MQRAAVFFDRDNTLIRNDGYLADPNQVVVIDGAADAIARVREFGFAVVTFSNQSGVARGMFTEETVRAVDARMDEMLREQNPSALIDAHEFCPYHPQATVETYRQESDLRKPKPGMILQAAQRLDIDLSRSWVVGDAPRDIEAGRAAGCRTILFHDPNLPPSEAARQAATIEPDFIVSSLKRAAQIVVREAGFVEIPAAAETNAAKGEHAAEPQEEPQSAAVDSQLAPPGPATPRVAATPARSSRRNRSSTPSPETDKAESSSSPTSSHQQSADRQSEKLEALAEQILDELRRHPQLSRAEFSVTRLLAQVVQFLTIFVLFYAYLHRADGGATDPLLLALFLETLTIALLIMGHQK